MFETNGTLPSVFPGRISFSMDYGTFMGHEFYHVKEGAKGAGCGADYVRQMNRVLNMPIMPSYST